MDVVTAKAHEAIDDRYVADADDNDWPSKDTQMLSKERVTAFTSGDHPALTRMDEALVKDFGPLDSTIETHGDKAFNVVKDMDGHQISICSNPEATIWVRVTEDQKAKSEAPPADRDKFVFNPTVEIGTLSKNGGKSVWTTSWWKDHIPDVTVTALSAGVGAVVGKSILSTLTKRANVAIEIATAGAARAQAQAALDAARGVGNKEEIDAAIKGLREARKLVDKLWMKNLPKGPWVEKFLGLATKFPKISAFLGGTIVTIVFQLFFEYVILPLIDKDYFIKLEICNFDLKYDWNVDKDWYHDNGIIAGGSAFQTNVIGHADNTVQTPFGPMPGEYTGVNSVTYIFQNSFTLLDGVGVAVKVQRSDKKAGCAMGYLCSYWKSNQLTVKGEFPDSSKAFYWDSTKWPKDLPLAVEDTISTSEDNIPIKGTTNALNKAEGNIYNFYVGIGKPF